LNGKMAILATGWEAAEATLFEKMCEKLAMIQEGMETAETRAQGRAEAARERSEEIKKESIVRKEWEEQQWGALGLQMQWEEKEIGGIKQRINSLVQDNGRERKRREEVAAAMEREVREAGRARDRTRAPAVAAPATGAPAPPKKPSPVRIATALPPIQVVAVADEGEEREIEDYSDMEGVQREGLIDSQHAPEAGEPDYMTQA
jgi:hypothetical protein